MHGAARNTGLMKIPRLALMAGNVVQPGPRFTADRIHQLWITPHGALKAAQRNNASVSAGEGGVQRLSFAQPGRLRATVTVNADGLVTQVDSEFPDPVMGDTSVSTTYADYKDYGGVKFPTRVRQTQGGHPVLELVIKEVQPNAAVTALAIPDAARNQGERVASEKVADGVWFIAGGSHNSVLIEMADHLVLVETPLNDARTGAVIDHVKTLVPGKPIRYAVNSHQHFDHSGGVRAAVAEGATVVTMAANVLTSSGCWARPTRSGPTAWPSPMRDRACRASRATRARWPTPRARSRYTRSSVARTATAC